MTVPARVGDRRSVVLVGWSGEDGQRQDSEADAKGYQRRDGMPGVGGALARWLASVPKPLAANDPGQQELAGGDEDRNGVLHAGMLADSWPLVLAARPDGGP